MSSFHRDAHRSPVLDPIQFVAGAGAPTAPVSRGRHVAELRPAAQEATPPRRRFAAENRRTSGSGATTAAPRVQRSPRGLAATTARIISEITSMDAHRLVIDVEIDGRQAQRCEIP
jgi:hypothetical protein